MSTNSENPVSASSVQVPLTLATIGIPALVSLALAIILNWGR